MRLTVIAVVVLVMACADHGLVPCGENACPRGFVCTPAGGCANPDQLAACNGKDDGTACTTTSISDGVCIAGACQVSTCGDGVVGPGEVCDDHDEVGGDGCSSDCRSTEVCGDEVVDPFVGEECDSGLAGRSSDGCASSCDVELELWSDRSPSPIGAGADIAMAYDAERRVVVLFGNVEAPAQTWEWNGTNWRRRIPPESPSGRKDHALAYDPARKRIVLFGGTGGGALLGDTWEWDGITWTAHTPSTPPAPRSGHAMGYMGNHGVVMFGGMKTSSNAPELTNELWSWNGTAWSLLGSTSSPPAPRTQSAIAVLPARGLVIFGGLTGSPPAATNEIWEWNGSWSHPIPTGPQPPAAGAAAMAFDGVGALLAGGTRRTWRWDGAWTNVNDDDEDVARFAHAFAWDAGRDRVVMFGGIEITPTGESAESADTVEWNPVARTWTLKTVAFAPTPRHEHAFVYDAARGEALLFGGKRTIAGTTIHFEDTWVWDGTSWLQRAATPSPSKRRASASAFDRGRSRVVLFGGRDGNTWFNDTWEWDGATWSGAIVAPTGLFARSGAAMVYDDARDQIVMFGGARPNGQPNHEMWTYEAGTWTLGPANVIPARSHHVMAYDAKRGVVVLHGGIGEGGVPLVDTWEWDGATWSEIEPAKSPPARTGAVLAYDPFRERAILTGGQFDDTWEWDGVRWTALAPLEPPPRRSGAAMIYDEVHRQLAMFGGMATEVHDNIAVRTYVSPGHAVERCLRAVDTDGDGLAGCADPDCAGRCWPGCAAASGCDPDHAHCGDTVCSPVEDYLICPADCAPP
jgi:cysteine-rich repeat protein